jgi:hypothetical protein
MLSLRSRWLRYGDGIGTREEPMAHLQESRDGGNAQIHNLATVAAELLERAAAVLLTVATTARFPTPEQDA